MDALDEHVRTDNGAQALVLDDRGIIAHPFDGGGVAQGEIFGEVVYQPEFP
jgi:hypothetical protein